MILEGIQDKFRRGNGMIRLVEVLARVGQFDEAKELAVGMEEEHRRGEALLAVARGLAGAGRFDEALEVASTSKEEQWSVDQELAGFVPTMTRGGDFDTAEKTLKRIKGGSDRNKALAALAVDLAEAGQYQRSWSHASRVSDRSERFAVCSGIVEAATRRGDEDQAQRALETAQGILDNLSGDWAVPEGMCQLARALAVGGKGPVAREMFARSTTDPAGEQVAVEPPGARTVLAKALRDHGRTAAAHTILKRLLAEAESLENHWLRFEACSEMTGILARQGEQRLVRRAFRGTLHAMKLSGRSEEGIPALVKTLVAMPRTNLRTKLLRKLKMVVHIHNLRSSWGTYLSQEMISHIAWAYGRFGDSKSARRLVKNLKHDRDRLQATRGILVAHLEADDTASALRQIEAMDSPSHRRLLIEELAEFIESRGPVEAHAPLLRSVLHVALAIPDQWLRINTLASLGDLLMELPELEEDRAHVRDRLRRELGEIIEDEDVHLQSRCIFASTLARYGDSSTARDALGRVASTIAGLAERGSSVTHQARNASHAMADAGMFEEALRYAGMMEEDERDYLHKPKLRHFSLVKPEFVHKSKAISHAVHRILETGDYRRALAIAGGIPDEQERGRALAHAATVIAAAYEDESFERFVSSEAMSTESWRRAITTWRAALLARGDLPTATLRRSMGYRPSDSTPASCRWYQTPVARPTPKPTGGEALRTLDRLQPRPA